MKWYEVQCPMCGSEASFSTLKEAEKFVADHTRFKILVQDMGDDCCDDEDCDCDDEDC